MDLQMAAVDQLPNEVLLRIFSSLKPYQLLPLEKVCDRWKCIIEEHVWSSLSSITKETIGYPNEDFLGNFIEIAHRIGQVKEFFSGFMRYFETPYSVQPKTILLKKAIFELIKKATPDAVFSQDLVQDLITIDVLLNPSRFANPVSEQQLHQSVDRVLKEIDVTRFGTLRIVRLSLLDSQAETDPFSISHNNEEIPLPINMAHFTKLNIALLAVRIGSPSKTTVAATRNVLTWISRLSHLEHVEVDKIHFFLNSHYGYDDPAVEMTFNFRPKRFQLSIANFVSFITAMMNKDESIRVVEMLQLISHWTEAKCLKKGDVSIYSNALARTKTLLKWATHAENGNSSRPNLVSAILERVCPSMTDKLYLGVPCDYHEEDQFVRLMMQREADTSLREFTVAFLGDLEGERAEKFVNGKMFEGTHRLRNLFHQFTRNLDFFKRLNIGFSANRKFDLYADFQPVVESPGCKPVPRLDAITYYGPPCFTSLLAIVAEAPNVTSLSLCSEWFEDERGTLECTKQLLDVLKDRPKLRSLCIQFTIEEVYQSWFNDRGVQRTPRDENGTPKNLELLAAIEQQLNEWVASSPHLVSCKVTIESLDFRFVQESENADNSVSPERRLREIFNSSSSSNNSDELSL